MTSADRRAVQKELLSALVEARKVSGLTQSELAARLQRSQSFVAKYEMGERKLDVVDYVLVCRALAIEPGSLLDKLTLRT